MLGCVRINVEKKLYDEMGKIDHKMQKNIFILH